MTGLAVPVTMLLLRPRTRFRRVGARGGAGRHPLLQRHERAGRGRAEPRRPVRDGDRRARAGARGVALWSEMVVRELAVYVVVLMLPLVFCAMVWPARRVWAHARSEVLLSLILAKFAIIVPLALGAAALAHGGAGSGVGRLIAGFALVGIGCMAPWLLMRLIPMAEVASAAVGHIRGQLHAHTGLPTPEAAVAGKVAQRAREAAAPAAGSRTCRSCSRAWSAAPSRPSRPSRPHASPRPAGARPTATGASQRWRSRPAMRPRTWRRAGAESGTAGAESLTRRRRAAGAHNGRRAQGTSPSRERPRVRRRSTAGRRRPRASRRRWCSETDGGWEPLASGIRTRPCHRHRGSSRPRPRTSRPSGAPPARSGVARATGPGAARTPGHSAPEPGGTPEGGEREQRALSVRRGHPPRAFGGGRPGQVALVAPARCGRSR